MKKASIALMGVVLLLASCAPDMNNEEEIVQDDESEEETAIVPSNQLSEENYRMILPYQPSEARGIIVDQVANRLDIDEMEQGMRRHSMEVYDPSDHYFQEGQYITESMVYDWLGRELTGEQFETELQEEIDRLEAAEMTINDEVIQNIEDDLQKGHNPPIEDDEDQEMHEENPRYLSHILEQNYLTQGEGEDDSVQLAGISIGLALKSVYRFQTEIGGPYYYEDIPENEMMEQGQEIAQSVLEEVRQLEGLENVPVMFSLYREEEQSSPVPGNFVAKTNVSGGETSIDDWESIDEETVLFPSDEGRDKYFEDHEIVSNFGDEIAEFFPNYTGIIGEGFYIDGQLQKLTIEIPLQFFGSAEVTGFTQFAYGLVQEMFADYYDLEINITSSDKVESLIYREAGEDMPNVHIYH
ncbi:protein involved in sex pheromone biosynthesis [Virgibacillus natechei]|uniref:Protein involved in sex pheromone biosynthesis n=1 Tax=Virgibacillus natechei TaxID=1216297 RepID=A0ABS4IIL3_9BACI|nr:CamS family sex pheromone protein [Virgibacillus natechei]MBP1970415.1 protein involved in sex pheromone biosynthesis [Virgibacillus natechei]UZD13929.1 CamS family sex pheromone protein [Virgibacillus natechei]